MKTLVCIHPFSVAFIALCLLFTGAPSSQGQVAPPDPVGIEPTPIASDHSVTWRDQNSEVWERSLTQPTRFGDKSFVHRILAMETGMNYRETEDGPWLQTKEEFEPVPGGALARQGPHQLFVANDLAQPGALRLTLSSGETLRLNPLMLSYFDPASGQSTRISDIKPCQGRIISPGVVLWENAFSDVPGSIRVSYRKFGMEHDVILISSDFPAPEEWGLSSQTALLQVITEIHDNPPLAKEPRVVRYDPQSALVDETLSIADTTIGPGKAFSLGEAASLPAVTVSKQLLKLDGGRLCLVEQMPYRHLKPHLDRLPRWEGALRQPAKPRERRLALLKDLLPPARRPQPAGNQPMELASVKGPASGLVLDYIVMNASATNQEFGSYYTYYITGTVNLRGVARFLPGAVLKFAQSPAATLIATNVVFESEATAPVFFTAATDNTVGETVSYAPITNYYGNIALNLSAAPTPQTVANARFCYLSNALAVTMQ